MKQLILSSTSTKTSSARPAWLWLLPAIAALVGCMTEPAHFRANLVRIEMEATEDEPVTAEQQREIAEILLAAFGDPDHPNDPFPGDEQIAKLPSLLESLGFDKDKLEVAAGRVYLDANGNQHGLYRLHCAHCHGITGDGKGPTASFLNPYPRDYRQGIFKFKSTWQSAKPTHEDLKRILVDGIPGTAMPSFKLLPNNEIDALLEYVKYLSVRGETEIRLIRETAIEGAVPTDIAAIALPLVVDEDGMPEDEPEEENYIASVMYQWAIAPQKVIHPVTPEFDFNSDKQKLAESIARGRDLFYSPKLLNCNSCHGDSAQGDGQTDNFSAWFKWREELDPQKSISAAELAPEIEQFMEQGALKPRTIHPRNLRLGVFRGGRRPIDIYRRIFSGINGTPMQGFGAETGLAGDAVPDSEAAGSITRQQIWDVVNYVRSLQYEPLSKGPHEREGPQMNLR